MSAPMTVWATKRGQLYGSRTAMPTHEREDAIAYVSAHLLADTLRALIELREEFGCGRIIFETPASEAAIPAIEAAFFALGHAGGNVSGTPHRAVWEQAQRHLAAIAQATSDTGSTP